MLLYDILLRLEQMWRTAVTVFKIFAFVLFGLVLYAFQGVYTTVIQPELATTVALDQFADPSVATDTASRTIPMLVNNACLLVWSAYGIGGIVLFRKEIRSFFTKDT